MASGSGRFSAGFSGARSGYGSGSQLYCDYSYSQSINDNYTDFSTNLHFVMSNASQTYSDSAWGAIGGSFARGSGTFSYNGNGDRLIIGSGSSRFYHNNEGECTITLRIYGDSGGTSMGSADSTTYITLPTIPRAGAIDSAKDINIGSNVQIKFTPKTTSHHFKLKFSLGDWTYTTGAISPASIYQQTYSSYTIPMTVCNQITNATSAKMSVSLYTYSSSACTSQIGSTSTSSFTVTVPTSVKPTVSDTSVSLSSSGASSTVLGWKLFVQNMSKADLRASANGSYGSTIKRFKITGGCTDTVDGTSLSYTTDYLSQSGDNITFTIVAVDSRGRESTAVTTRSIKVYPYSPPRITGCSIYRDSTSKSYVICNAAWEFSSINGNNSASATLKYKKRSDTGYNTLSGIQMNNSQPISTITFDQNASYDTILIVQDTVGNTAQLTSSLTTIQAVMDFKPNGQGIAIGKMSETNSMFEVDWDTRINGELQIEGGATIKNANNVSQSLLDYLHPIGKIIWTFDSSFNPQTAYGGTWQLISEGHFITSAGENYTPYISGSLASYGANTHILTEDEIPSHKHSIYSTTGKDFTVANGIGSGVSGIPCGSQYSGWGSYTGAHWFYQSQSMTQVGGGLAHNNMPLSHAAYCWYRIA